MVSDKNGCKKNKLFDCNGTPTRYHLVHKRTLNNLAKPASVTKRLNIRLRTKWLWVRLPLQSLYLSYLLQARNSLTFRQL